MPPKHEDLIRDPRTYIKSDAIAHICNPGICWRPALTKIPLTRVEAWESENKERAPDVREKIK